MIFFHELIQSLVTFVNIFFTVLYWMLILRIVLAWFGVHPFALSNELLSALYQVTDLILRPFQRLPLQIGLFDLSPIVAFLALQFLQRVIVLSLYALGGMLR